MKFTSHSQIIRSRLLKPGPVARSGMALLFVFGGSVLFARPSHLPPAPSRVQHASGAFTTGQYRNLFVEGGHPAEEVTNKINAAFQQLFHGDPASQAVYYMAGLQLERAARLCHGYQTPRCADRGHVLRHDDRGSNESESRI